MTQDKQEDTELRNDITYVLRGVHETSYREGSTGASESPLFPRDVEKIMSLVQRYTEQRERAAMQEGQLIGAAKVLDSLWDNSYYSLGAEASKRIESEMIYYFGQNWTGSMYDVMTWDGQSKPSRHPEPIPTLAELEAQRQSLSTTEAEL